MADQPKGFDISSGNGPVNFLAAYDAGFDFVFIKGAEGNGYTNPLFASQWPAAKAAGIIRGAYLFFRWDVDPAAQAAHLLAVVGSDRGELPLTVDVENTGDGAGAHNYPVSEMTRRVRVCVDALKAATGRAPIIYTYPSMWRDTLGNPTTFTDCLLWLASYTPLPPKPVGGWPSLTFWQNSDKGTVPGVDGHVDTDLFNGTMDQLHALAGMSAPKPPPPPPVLYFSQTGQYVQHGFLDYYLAHPERNLGLPLTGEFACTLEDGNNYTVQLFERGLLQYSPTTGVQEARVGFMWGKLDGILK